MYELRHAEALSQAELAGRLEVTQGAISKLESTRRMCGFPPSANTLRRWARWSWWRSSTRKTAGYPSILAERDRTSGLKDWPEPLKVRKLRVTPWAVKAPVNFLQ